MVHFKNLDLDFWNIKHMMVFHFLNIVKDV